MHIVFGVIVGGGFVYAWQHSWLKTSGTFGPFGATIIIYNLLIAQGGIKQYVAYTLPALTMIMGKIIR